MKLGIIGSGQIVRDFLPKLVKMEGMEVVAIMDIPAVKEPLEALCRENGVANAVTDFEDYNFYVSGGSAYYKNSEGYSGRVVGGNSPVAAAIYRYVQQGYPSRMSG